MARLKVLRDFVTGERFYKEPATGMSFRRIAGGLVWPVKDKPGCVICLAETRSRPNILGERRHDVHKLCEVQSEDCGRLVDQMIILTEEYFIPAWATPLCDKRSYLLEDANDLQRRRKRPVLRYGDPQGFTGKGEGLLPFYHALAQRRTLNEKTLFLGGGECADELASLPYAAESGNLLDYPSAAALCFALGEFDINPVGEKLEMDKEAWGPADDMGGY